MEVFTASPKVLEARRNIVELDKFKLNIMKQSKQKMKKITVIGATGMIGIPVTKELINAGFDVTALVSVCP
jgi:hypothetical protein